MDKAYKPSSWDLSDILPKDFDAKCDEIKKLAKKFCRCKNRLNPRIGAEELKKILKLFDRINMELHIIETAYSMRFGEDTADSESSRMLANADRFSEEIRNKIDFFDSWVLGLSHKGLRRVLSRAGEYKPYIKSTYRSSKFLLDGDIEDTLCLKEAISSPLRSRLYDQIVSCFRYPMAVDGQDSMLSTKELLQQRSDPDSAKRADAYERILHKYSEFAHVLAEIYTAEARDWHNEYVKTRKYPSPMSVVNSENGVPDSTVDTLLASCRRNRSVFQRHFKLKAKACGLEGRISIADTDAPMFGHYRKLSFDESVRTVMDAFSSFSQRFACLAKKVIESKHLHSINKLNQTEGAFCQWVAPGFVPYVNVAFEDGLDFAQNLAHELGHAVQYQLIGEKQNWLTGETTTVLAETVSIFSEQLLLEHMISHAHDDSARKNLLGLQLDNAYQSTVEQAYNVLFEKDAHEMINSAQGAGLEQLSGLYHSHLKEKLGGSIAIPGHFKNYWLAIAHIFDTPFYCYSYPFGYLVSLILNQKRKSQGFVRDFERVISYGSSVPTARAFKELGIDINSNSLWQDGFDILNEKVSYLESLCR